MFNTSLAANPLLFHSLVYIIPYELIEFAVIWIVVSSIALLLFKMRGRMPKIELLLGTLGSTAGLILLIGLLLYPSYYFSNPIWLSTIDFTILVAFICPGFFFLGRALNDS